MRIGRAAAWVVAGLCASANASDPAPERGTWIPKYEALHCDPVSIRMASRDPLRFAVLGACFHAPIPPRHSDKSRLVTVDAARNEVRIFDFAGSIRPLTLSSTPQGRWRWFAPTTPQDSLDVELKELSPGEQEPRTLGRLTLPFEAGRFMFALNGNDCWLMSGTTARNPGELWPPVFTLVRVANGAPVAAATPPLRGIRFWHIREQAFVVQTDAEPREFALLDCAGHQRRLGDPDADRMGMLGNYGTPAIASNGDWLFSGQSGESGHPGLEYSDDEIHIVQRDAHRTFGWFGKPAKGCPDFNCIFDTDTLEDPEWSPGEKYFLVQGYPRSYVLRSSDLAVILKWSPGLHGRTALLSDSLAMSLSKNRGVAFRRW